ncbi:uncharacterized protein BCR38DRAFT_422520 [Pseudomassariella vexata]|uniref:Uncharacterized protein n=1 Tax=Pseudomassariella vexata TaxID=1141098 RepID=A0A1Y2EAF3_9PEZI|nr:uncharacterized protein BCR38DRAFT_422520 [Pseudomassariella vexata]ORY68236.1 hypothetical protein BCR38DRAFT_422520 [Pseudomassariella vexata]
MNVVKLIRKENDYYGVRLVPDETTYSQPKSYGNTYVYVQQDQAFLYCSCRRGIVLVTSRC